MAKKIVQIDVEVAIIEFKEDGLHFFYSPALDITGYGKTKTEARDSYNLTVEEFMKYTYNKQTLLKELERLGWTISKKNKISVPTLSSLIQNRSYLEEILTEKKFHKSDEKLTLPAFA
jgi:hypothetical protein